MQHLIQLWRTLYNQRLYTTLNVVGLALGIAVFFTLYIFLQYELSFDRWIPDAERIYRVNNSWDLPSRPAWQSENSQGIALPLLISNFPSIKAGTRLRAEQVVMRAEKPLRDTLHFADPQFFEVFDLPLIAGNREQALADPNGLILTQSAAQTYFGDLPVIGQAIRITVSGEERTYHITGLMADFPNNTTLGNITMLAQLHRGLYSDSRAKEIFDDWGSQTLYTYLRFNEKSDADGLNAELADFVLRHAGEQGQWMSLDILPLPSLRIANAQMISSAGGVSAFVLAALALIGPMTLLIGGINYTNLATVQASRRTTEIALHKIHGGDRRTLIRRFIMESISITSLSGLFGIILVSLFAPTILSVAGLGSEDVSIGTLNTLGVFLVVVIVVGFGAGLYPAFVLTRPAPVQLMSGYSAKGGRRGLVLREALVTGQFAVATIFLVSTLTIWAQTTYLRQADLGFEKDSLILINDFQDAKLEGRRALMMETMRNIPGVLHVTASTRAPGSGNVVNTNVSRPGHQGPEPSIVTEVIGSDYFKTYRIPLLAGRLFDPSVGKDDVRGSTDNVAGHNVILNAQGASLLDFKTPQDAIGRTIRFGGSDVTVIGVVKNARFNSPKEPMPPVIYFYYSAQFPNTVAAIRYQGANANQMAEKLEEHWYRVAADIPFGYQTARESLDQYYQADESRHRIFATSAILAVLISCIGLFGLVTFTAERRTKELAIRKIMGASVGHILSLLTLKFLRPVLLANLIAWPVSFLLMRHWLDGFHQRIDLNIAFFLGAMIATSALAALSILSETVRAARRNPAMALKHE